MRYLGNLTQDGGYESLETARAACERIHAFLQATLPGYNAARWADPMPRLDMAPDDPAQSWLVPIDLEHRGQFVDIPPGEAGDIAARLLPEDFDISPWIAQSEI